MMSTPLYRTQINQHWSVDQRTARRAPTMKRTRDELLLVSEERSMQIVPVVCRPRVLSDESMVAFLLKTPCDHTGRCTQARE